jgi:DNA-binding MarR family transcriptional regulator
MSERDNPMAQKLLQSFRQFYKSDWHRRSHMGYKSSDIRVLFCIKNREKADPLGMMVSEISQLLCVSPPTITQLIKGLEINGLIKRSMDLLDKRAVRIKLTEDGEMVAKKASGAILDSFNGLVEFLGEEQSNQLAELFSKVFVYFNEHAVNQANWKGENEE